jgi:pSer/pThr/pTyr-binding forkhead associated (FHA) protein
MAKLRIKDESGKERIHELVDDVTTIGRASSNLIQITDEKASRNHFRVEKTGKTFKIVDLGSTNGVRLNGIKITGEKALNPRDTISLGKTTFTFEDPDAPPPPEATGPVSGGETVELDPVLPDKPTDPDKVEGPKYVLKVLEGKNPGKVYELGVQALTMGRHNTSTIQIIDDAASNYHAEINREPIGYVLTDLGSTNGTRVRFKNRTEFEKIVKTPLSVGMQIRVGKTLLEFDNIGKAVEDDALFGTIALDPDKLEAKLTQPRPAKSRVALIAVAALLFFVVVGAVVHFASPKPPPPQPIVESTENLIPNGDFDEPSDDNGRPPHFQVIKNSPEVRVSVAGKAARLEEGEHSKGLQISKGGAKSAAALTIVETKDSFSVDPSKVYEFKAWMRNEGDGLIGLRVTWIGGNRQLTDSQIVLRDPQDWKEKSALLAPPKWAQFARPGIFVQGKEGIASFDALNFRPKPGESVSAPPVVTSGTIRLTFETNKGVFSADSLGVRVIENAQLQLANSDRKTDSDLSTAFDPNIQIDGGKTSVRGNLYDFQTQDAVEYAIESSRVSNGVDVKVAINRTGSTTQFSFDLVGFMAGGEIELLKSGDVVERVRQGEKTIAGVRNILFNAGATPQLDISFADTVDVDISKGDGKRRTITLRFEREVKLAIASESVRYKEELANALKELSAAMDAKNWGEAETRAGAIRQKFASKFPQASRAADQAQQRIEQQWQRVTEDFDRALKTVTAAPSPEIVKNEIDTMQALLPVWTPSSKAAELKANIERLQSVAKQKLDETDTVRAEKDAAQWLADADLHIKNKNYTIAISILNKRVINDDRLGKTKAAAKAKEQVAAMREEIDSLQTALLDQVKPLSGTKSSKDWRDAVDRIEKNKDYMKYKSEMPQVDEMLKDLKARLVAP